MSNLVKGIFDELKQENNNIELSDELKNKFLETIDITKDSDGYYLDAFDNRISFNGIRQLKKPYTKLKLTSTQQNEILKCHQDYFYFRRNYCKILTKSGIGRPEPRQYQVNLEKELVKGDDVLAFFPRQCIYEDTLINNKLTIKELYNKYKDRSTNIEDDLFVDTIEIMDKNEYTFNEKGKLKINYIHKTKKLPLYEIKLENGMSLKGSKNHIIIDENYDEIPLYKSKSKYIVTKQGLSKVLEVINLNKEINMYDIGVNSIDELYFSNNILSHNSGKTVTIAIYLLWCALTRNNINIGISANVVSLAQEVLDKLKKIFIEMPIWLQPGVVSWNKRGIELENGNKVMIAASNSDAFRGFSLSILYLDEVGFVKNNLFDEFMDSVMPAMAAIQNSQFIGSSTAAGLNHWYHMVEGARKKAKEKVDKEDIVILKDGTEMNIETYYKFFKDKDK